MVSLVYFLLCVGTITKDLMMVVQPFLNSNQQGLQFLNQAYVVLIPKKSCPQQVSDFRPISITHNFAKLISKVMANRLGPKLDHLVAVN
jgi:hypothetical protein